MKRPKFSPLRLSVFLALALISFSCKETEDGIRFVQNKEGIEEYQLVNGLQVLLKEDASAPAIALVTAYRAGSKFETDGTRGSAHLLEHMLFKDTENFRGAEGRTIFGELQKVGAQMNASTWQDGIQFYELLPAGKLDLGLEIEADRMRRALLQAEDLKSEMPVVQSEFDQIENSPILALTDAVWKKAFTKHPYHYQAIGDRKDLSATSPQSLRKFYERFFVPSNAVLIVIGNFEKEEALTKIAAFFGGFEAPKDRNLPNLPVEPAQTEKRMVRVTRQDPTQAVSINNKIPNASHPDLPALEVAAQIIGGNRLSRLYPKLIESGIAVEVQSQISRGADPGLFETQVKLAPHTDPSRVEKIVFETYDEIRNAGVEADELVRAQNRLLASKAYNRDGFLAQAAILAEAWVAGDWGLEITYAEKIRQVSGGDIKRVVGEYLTPQTATVGYLISETQPYVANVSALDSSSPAAVAKKEGEPVQALELDLHFPAAQPGVLFSESLAERARVFEKDGLKIISIRMNAPQVVTIKGSIPGCGKKDASNPLIPVLLAELLNQGTQKRSKEKISNFLDAHGADLSFEVDYERVLFHLRCLRPDIPVMIQLLAEMLRTPKFSDADFEIQKKSKQAELLAASTDTLRQAYAAFTRMLYAPNHPYYVRPIEEQLKDLESIQPQDVMYFHEKHYGPQSMTVVGAGDVNGPNLEQRILQAFLGWPAKPLQDVRITKRNPPTTDTALTPIANKIKIDAILGHAIPFTRTGRDYLPLSVGVDILGGGPTARLFGIVRGQQGLTYTVYSGLGGFEKDFEGYWFTHLILNRNTLEPGIRSVRTEIRRFIRNGVSKEELDAKKRSLIGGYKLGFSTTDDMVSKVLEAENWGLGIKYLENYPKLLEKMTLNDVNTALQKYLDIEELQMSLAGEFKTQS